MVNGPLKMKHLSRVICGALLLTGLAGIVPTPASAGTYYDSVCNCRRPDSEYTTRRYERAAPQINTRTRYVDHTREVKKTRLIQENRLIVHVRPVIAKSSCIARTQWFAISPCIRSTSPTGRRLSSVTKRSIAMPRAQCGTSTNVAKSAA